MHIPDEIITQQFFAEDFKQQNVSCRMIYELIMSQNGFKNITLNYCFNENKYCTKIWTIWNCIANLLAFLNLSIVESGFNSVNFILKEGRSNLCIELRHELKLKLEFWAELS